MTKDSYRDIFIETKNFYSAIGVLLCPALENQPVHFNSIGFTHLMRKGKDLRPINDQMRRFVLLHYAPKVIQYGKKIGYRIFQKKIVVKSHKSKKEKMVTIQFWTLSLYIDSKQVKVIIIQEGNGQKNFLSIM